MKVPEPRKLKSGTWFIQLRLGGVSIPVSASSAKECKRRATLIKAEHGVLGRPLRDSTPILRSAIDRYIADKANTLSPSTIRGYRTIQRSYIQDAMDEPIQLINWQREMNNMAKTYAPKTVKNTWRFVCSVLRYHGIEPPKVLLPQLVNQAHPFLEPEQITSFIAAINGKPCEIPALLALHSLRRSEIMALTWDKINLKRQSITVSGAAVFDEAQQLIVKHSNKNSASARTIPIMIPALMDALNGIEPKTGRIVTCNPNTIWAQINRVCRAEGLPEIGVHGLRHSFASLAYHLGLSERETMEIGGWSDTQTMHRIYTHLAQSDRLNAQNKLHQFFLKNANKNAN